jgi:Fe-S cluster assembly protein SufD
MTNSPVIIKRSIRSTAANEFTFTENNIPISGNTILNNFRQNAWKNYQSISYPGEKDEAWRRTALTGMDRSSYRIEIPQDELSKMPEGLKQPLAGDQQDGQVIVQPGKSSGTLSEIYQKQGVIFNSFSQAIQQNPDLLEKLGTIVKPGEDKFTALTAALADDGVILYIPKDVKIIHPLHSILWGGGEKSAIFSHLLIWLEEGAEVTYVHEFASSNDKRQDMLHCGLVEVHAGPESHLKFVELQSWGRGVWNITHERAVIQHDAQVEWIFGAVGSRLTKNFTDFDLSEAGATIKASGFFFADGRQHFDHDTQQNHLAPNTTSDLLYKGAVTDESYSVWQGMIYVAPGAEKTDGYQANRNLILCKKARADSIPGLEILADDVRCSHGATVGKIDEEQIYYLQTRGLTTSESKRLIVEGFFEPVMDRIPFEGVKNRFREAIHQKMNTICE